MKEGMWTQTKAPIPYPDAIEKMEDHVSALHLEKTKEWVWLLEHPPLYTAGTSTRLEDIISPLPFPIYQTGRGGQLTYHGPGQRVGYVMINLKNREQNIRAYITALEEWIILTLNSFKIKGERRQGRIGIWVTTLRGEEKIASIGVRVRGWITYHGFSLNIHPDLTHFSPIVACGLPQFGVTSFEKLNISVSLCEVDHILKKMWVNVPFLSQSRKKYDLFT